MCSWCRSSLSQRPLHTCYCHLRSSASAICSDWYSTGSMHRDCNWTMKFRTQRTSHMELSATSTTVPGPVGEHLQVGIEDALGLQLDNEVSQSTDQPHRTVCHQHYGSRACRRAPSSGHRRRTGTATGQWSFAVNGPATWNCLPPALRFPGLSESTFKWA